jgi:hypothetical protein
MQPGVVPSIRILQLLPAPGWWLDVPETDPDTGARFTTKIRCLAIALCEEVATGATFMRPMMTTGELSDPAFLSNEADASLLNKYQRKKRAGQGDGDAAGPTPGAWTPPVLTGVPMTAGALGSAGAAAAAINETGFAPAPAGFDSASTVTELLPAASGASLAAGPGVFGETAVYGEWSDGGDDGSEPEAAAAAAPAAGGGAYVMDYEVDLIDNEPPDPQQLALTRKITTTLLTWVADLMNLHRNNETVRDVRSQLRWIDGVLGQGRRPTHHEIRQLTFGGPALRELDPVLADALADLLEECRAL